jgi:hypothetical protein
MDNLNIKGSLVQKWMKRTSAATRKSKVRKMMRGEDPGSPLTPGITTFPHSKRLAEDMFDGKRQYVIGYIEQASKKEMAELKRNINLLFANANNRARILSPSHSNIIYKALGNSSTRSNRNHIRSKIWIDGLLRVYNTRNAETSTLLRIIYDALPSKY